MSNLATERMDLEAAAASISKFETLAHKILFRLNKIRPLHPEAAILDVGAGPGRLAVALARRGYSVTALEPWDKARQTARRLAEQNQVRIEVLDGTAEDIPTASEKYDLVLASSVLEHVSDPAAAIREAYRVLKAQSVFWFSSESSLCPRQNEIQLFPLFGWYPDRLKRRIMRWAADSRPELIGHTETPAVNWWTPWKAERMLVEAGFREIYDRWDLRDISEGGRVYGWGLTVVRLSPFTKLIADIMIPSCAYAALK